MSREQNNRIAEETPHDMMKRVFAVAELIVRSDGYQPTVDAPVECVRKHKPVDLRYRKEQQVNSGLLDGTKEA